MRQALILCGGQAKRLRPYSYCVPKASFPFLNLPLMFLSWFYAEKLKINHFLLNSHLFPKQLQSDIIFLSKNSQKADLFFEKLALGGAGTLLKLKKELQKTEEFLYINGDSLFFPSQLSRIYDFEKLFLESQPQALFFTAPYRPAGAQRALWRDREFNLKFVGSKKDLPGKEQRSLKAVSWTGMALFKSSLLDHLQKDSFDLFQDFINPLLKKHKIKVYEDPATVLLEAGDKSSCLSAMNFCLKCLFQFDLSSTHSCAKKAGRLKVQDFDKRAVQEILEECFKRFDPDDKRVGLKNGKIWSQKFKHPVLLPQSVQGLEFLKLQGPAVIGRESCFFDETALDNSVLDLQIAFSGCLKQDILLKKNRL